MKTCNCAAILAPIRCLDRIASDIRGQSQKNVRRQVLSQGLQHFPGFPLDRHAQ